MRRQVDAELARLGVCYRGRIWRLFALRDVAQALGEVEDCLRAGQRIVNPAGLLVRVLEGNTGRSVFR